MAAAADDLWGEMMGLESEIALLLRLIKAALADDLPERRRRTVLTRGRALRARTRRLRLLSSRSVRQPPDLPRL